MQCDYIDAPFEFDEELEIRLVKSDGKRLHTFASKCRPWDNNIWRWEFEDCEYRDRYRDQYFQIQVYGADLEFEIQVIVVHKTFKSMQDWKTMSSSRFCGKFLIIFSGFFWILVTLLLP